MFFLSCTMVSSVDLAHYGVSSAKDRVSVDCDTIMCLIRQPFCFVWIANGTARTVDVGTCTLYED